MAPRAAFTAQGQSPEPPRGVSNIPTPTDHVYNWPSQCEWVHVGCLLHACYGMLLRGIDYQPAKRLGHACASRYLVERWLRGRCGAAPSGGDPGGRGDCQHPVHDHQAPPDSTPGRVGDRRSDRGRSRHGRRLAYQLPESPHSDTAGRWLLHAAAADAADSGRLAGAQRAVDGCWGKSDRGYWRCQKHRGE
jgi:hypothetical protein